MNAVWRGGVGWQHYKLREAHNWKKVFAFSKKQCKEESKVEVECEGEAEYCQQIDWAFAFAANYSLEIS